MIERERDIGPDNLPDEIAIFPLPGALLLPGGQLPLNIFEPRYLNLIEDALGAGRLMGMIQPFAETDERQIADGTRTYDVGCLGRISQFSETDDGRYIIILDGVARFRVAEELPMRDGYRRVVPDFTFFADDLDRARNDEHVILENRDGLLTAMQRYFDSNGLSADMESIAEASDAALVTSLAMSCPLAPGEKQALLECRSMAERGALLTSMFEIGAHGDGEFGPGLRQ